LPGHRFSANIKSRYLVSLVVNKIVHRTGSTCGLACSDNDWLSRKIRAAYTLTDFNFDSLNPVVCTLTFIEK